MKSLMECTCGENWKELAFTALRVVTGLAFLTHGYAKVFVMGQSGVTGFFSTLGVPAANVFAFLVMYGELLGGIALIVGFMSHWVSKAFIIILLGAIGLVHWSHGYGAATGGYEYPLLLLAASLFFVAYGSGSYSVDAYLKKQRLDQ